MTPPADLREPVELAGQLSVVIPVYNEEATIEQLVNLVLARPEPGELIIVNDASKDRSWERLQAFRANPRVKLFNQEVNQGKGAAVIRAFSEATQPYVLSQEAAFEYSPEDYPTVLAPLAAGKADVVYGSRFMGTPGMVRYFRHEMGNKVLTFFSNLCSDIHLSDMETCYKAFRREVIQNLKLDSQRFGIEVEMTAKLAKCRCLRIWEVPISYNPRRYDEGKKITWKDGIAALWHIFKYNCLAFRELFYMRPWSEVLGEERAG